jgi:hypothetical protein
MINSVFSLTGSISSVLINVFSGIFYVNRHTL